LPLANFIVLAMSRDLWRTPHLVVSASILAASVVFFLIDFRFLHAEPALPTSGGGAVGAQERATLLEKILTQVPVLATDLTNLLGAVFVLVTVAGLLAYFLVRLWSARCGAWSAVVLAAVGSAALFNQLVLAAFILLGALLVGWIDARSLFRPPSRSAMLTIIVVCLIWIGYAVYMAADTGSVVPLKALIRFPELLYSIVYPWLMAIPAMAVLLGAGTAVLTLYVVIHPNQHRGERFLIALVLLSVTFIGIAPTMYEETRYSFHLYPLGLILALTGVKLLVDSVPRLPRRTTALPAAGAVAYFLFSADFAISHLVTIDQYDSNFRVGYDDRVARHYYPRFDFATPAAYVESQRQEDDIIITSDVTLAEYLPNTDYVYMSASDPRYVGQACERGTRERWTGSALLSSREELADVVRYRSESEIWLIADWQSLEHTLPHQYLSEDLTLLRVFVSPDQRFAVYRRESYQGKPTSPTAMH